MDNISTPSVTVVIPCHNAEKWIYRAITSVLGQTCSNLHVIVVDDGSSDRSLEIIKSFKHRIAWKTGLNKGACYARNRGLALCESDYVLFLDADDYIEKDAIGHWVKAASEAKSDVLLGLFDYERDGFRTSGRPPNSPVSSVSILCQWLEGWFTPPCAVLWRCAFLNSIGGWNERALRRQDSELVVRGLLKGAKVAISNEGRGVYVQHDSPTRVSRRGGRPELQWELCSLRNLWALAQESAKYSTRAAFSVAFYHLAYDAFSEYVDDVGQSALKEARALGLQGHIGSLRHRVLAKIFGLRRKMHLTMAIRRTRRA